jgi:chromosomal replication initiation ATPase DnaA
MSAAQLTPRVPVAAILRAVSAEFGIPEAELLSPRRMARSCVPRHAVMGLARQMTRHSSTALGRMLRRDHTTVLSASRRHAERLARDPDYAARVRAVSERLQRSLSNA